jgi:ketosteroid isomerase-like protein
VYEIMIVKDIYRAFARADMASVLAAFDAGIEWRLAEGHIYAPEGGAFHGVREVAEQFFARLGPEWENFVVAPARMHEAGDTIIVEGRYTGQHKRTGNLLDAQFCHLWTLRDDKVIRFQQYMDTAQLRSAAAPSHSVAGWSAPKQAAAK